MSRKRVEPRVGCRVVGLAGTTEDAHDRRTTDKGLERELARELVEEPRALDLGGEAALDLHRIHLVDQGVVEHPGGMDDAGQGSARRERVEQGCERRALRDVARLDLDLGPQGFELGPQ